MTKRTFDLIVIGGGAAGFFGAIQAAEMNSNLKILILEKSSKILSKVKVSGGGRCNVTHHEYNPTRLKDHYPRGRKELKSLFKVYHAEHVVNWFLSKGVKLKTEADGRMFPETDISQTIVDCFIRLTERYKIQIETAREVQSVKKIERLFTITVNGEDIIATSVLVASGGNPKIDSYNWLRNLNLRIIPPVPSLFTFNDPGKTFQDLMGVSVTNVEVKIAGTKFLQTGPLLITHWGLSGPAVIKLSAWSAEHLASVNYDFTALVSWIGSVKEEDVRNQLKEYQRVHKMKKVFSNPLYQLPQRLWTRLCEQAEIEESKIWNELPQRNVNKLLESLIRCPFLIKGKTTFKEEFVTCGGVDLAEIDLDRMESKAIKNLFFAGEVLNIDGETGGFNFQAAWTTAYIAASTLSRKT